MPPAPPVRPGGVPYRFHTYDFNGSVAFTQSAAQPAAGNMRFYSLLADLNALAAIGVARNVPNVAISNVGGVTSGGRGTRMLSFGNAANAANAPAVVITGGIHAREWIAVEMAYLVAEYLIVNYPDPAGGPPANPRVAHLQNLVDNRNIHITPMLNPDGNIRTVFGGDRFWRKNTRALPYWGQGWIAALVPGGPPNAPTPPFMNVQRTGLLSPWAQYDVPDYDPAQQIPPGAPANYRTRTLTNLDTGVDLNRNFATPAWAYDCGGGYRNWSPSGESFFGTAPGGEQETSNVQQAMAAAAAAGVGGNLSASIDYHSYGRMILYASEVFNAPGGIAQDYRRLAETIQLLVVDPGNQQYALGSASAVIHYEATGTVADRAGHQHQSRAVTIELDPASGQGAAGFALAENQIQTVFETNIRGALAAIETPTTLPLNLAVRNNYMAWAVQGAGNQVP